MVGLVWLLFSHMLIFHFFSDVSLICFPFIGSHIRWKIQSARSICKMLIMVLTALSFYRANIDSTFVKQWQITFVFILWMDDWHESTMSHKHILYNLNGNKTEALEAQTPPAKVNMTPRISWFFLLALFCYSFDILVHFKWSECIRTLRSYYSPSLTHTHKHTNQRQWQNQTATKLIIFQQNYRYNC